MSIIKLPILYAGTLGEKILYTLFDSGSDYSCVHPDQIQGLEIPIPLGHVRRFCTASEGQYIEIREAVRLDFYIDDILLSDEFFVVPGLSEDAVFGAATLQKWRIKLDFENDRVLVNPRLGGPLRI